MQEISQGHHCTPLKLPRPRTFIGERDQMRRMHLLRKTFLWIIFHWPICQRRKLDIIRRIPNREKHPTRRFSIKSDSSIVWIHPMCQFLVPQLSTDTQLQKTQTLNPFPMSILPYLLNPSTIPPQRQPLLHVPHLNPPSNAARHPNNPDPSSIASSTIIGVSKQLH